MKILSTVFCFTLIIGIGPASILGQKPVAKRSFETIVENGEASFLSGTMRLSGTSGQPMAIYNEKYKVQKSDPRSMALEYLQANNNLFGLTEKEFDGLKLHMVRESHSGTTVRLRQHYEDFPVGKAEITVHFNNTNEVTYVMNGFRYGINPDNLSINESVQSASSSVKQRIGLIGKPIEENQSLEIFYNNGDPRLVRKLTILSNEPLGEWEAMVDASSGEILQLKDNAFYYHKHKEALLPGIPPSYFNMLIATGSGNIFDPDPLSSSGATYNDTGFIDGSDATTTELDAELINVTLDVTFDGTNYHLVGPWAEIQDFESPSRGLFQQPSDAFIFNRSDDGFEAVNTYYHIHESMDYINNDLGLNIKPSAYPTGVRFDPHGLNGSDNSHYLGGSQRLAFGEGGVDDAEDSDVIHHELGHGLHDWVTAGGLSQVNGLSEGIGDYWAASYNRSLGNWTPSKAPYNWVFNWDGHNPFWNGRRVDYGNSYPDGLVGQIHTDGQIWATAMMKVWDAIGKFKTDLIFWEGVAMTNGSSNQEDAANAVYQAAMDMNYNEADLIAITGALTSSGYDIPGSTVPVEISSFSGFQFGNTHILEWATASEINNAYFDIERSGNNLNFTSIGKVTGHGTTKTSTSYTFTDVDPDSGINYYRLQQVDIDGKSSISPVISIQNYTDNIKISPNPAADQLFIFSDKTGEVQIYDALGRWFLKKSISGNGQDHIDISSLRSGVFYVQVTTNGHRIVRKMVKQ
jgi:Zn-dependent metalloprotease